MHVPDPYEGDLEAAGTMIKAALKSKSPKKRKRRKKSAGRPTSNKISDAIIAEMKSLGIGVTNLPFAFKGIGSSEYHIVEPIRLQPLTREHRWTADLPGFEEAQLSARNAIMFLVAQTEAMRCSFEADSAYIEQLLFSIRAGLIGPADNRIIELIRHAQQIGKGRTIYRGIDAALHDAERRKRKGTVLFDLNTFRLTLAYFWIGFLFWLMSDGNIAAFIANLDSSLKCDPSSVTKARKDLRLIKSERLLVKAVGKNFHWTFVSGYPPPG
jgi:hypothetical protein